MKKIILLAAFGVAGMLSAKNAEETKPTKDTEKEKKEIVKEKKANESCGSESKVLQYNCIEYSMYIPCLDMFLDDQVCYGSGACVSTWDDAWNCMTTNGTLATKFFCG